MGTFSAQCSGKVEPILDSVLPVARWFHRVTEKDPAAFAGKSISGARAARRMKNDPEDRGGPETRCVKSLGTKFLTIAEAHSSSIFAAHIPFETLSKVDRKREMQLGERRLQERSSVRLPISVTSNDSRAAASTA